MKRILHDADVNRAALDGKTIGIIGYGIQGRAQALNLRDSGCNVVVGGRAQGKGIAAAKGEGFKAYEIEEAVRRSDVVFVLTPDDVQKTVLSEAVTPYMREHATIGFACGYAVRFLDLELPRGADVVMVSPKGPGRTLRERFVAGSGLPALVGVAQDLTGVARDTAVAYAGAIGSGRVGIIESSFAEEAETDLFGEQAVLCGGIPRLMAAGFDLLVSKGYSPEAAYIECIWEAKAIVDLIYAGGIENMYANISPTARYGGLTRGGRVIDADAEKKMSEVLDEIRNGTFAVELSSARRAKADISPTLRETGRRLLGEFGG